MKIKIPIDFKKGDRFKLSNFANLFTIIKITENNKIMTEEYISFTVSDISGDIEYYERNKL